MEEVGILKEFNLTTDDFKNPEIYKGKKAVGLLVCRLLLLEPGTNPNRPEMGVGLVSKYRYMFPDRLQELKNDIYDQLARYLFPYQRVGIAMDVVDKELRMDITIDDTTYKYVTKEQEDNTITLQELRDNVEEFS